MHKIDRLRGEVECLIMFLCVRGANAPPALVHLHQRALAVQLGIIAE